MHIPHYPDEIVALVDANDEIVGEATRRAVHKEDLLHREVYVYIMHSDQILLQKRSDIHKWDHSAGGHFPKEQTYEQAAIRETKEELGIDITLSDLIDLGKPLLECTSHNCFNRRFAKIFLVKKDIKIEDIRYDSHEIEDVKFFPIDDFPDDMTTTAAHIIGEYLQAY